MLKGLMSVWQFLLRGIREIKKDPRNGWYFIQGTVRWWIHGKAITKFLRKKNQCPTCFETGECQSGCGCEFHKVALSNKKCNVE